MAKPTRSEIAVQTPRLQELTADEFAAAEQLVQLSGSGEDSATLEESSCSLAAAASSTPDSFNTGHPVLIAMGCEEEDDQEEEMGPRRWNHRCRLISDLYEATIPIYVGDFSKIKRSNGRR